MTEHKHNANAAAGKDCSHLVTAEQFAAWGLTLELRDKVVGTAFVVREGITHREALMTAWGRGLVRLCTVAPVVQVNFVQTEQRRAAAIAWVAEHKKVLAR